MEFSYRKKDYLQRLIESFFMKLQELVDQGNTEISKTKEALNNMFSFYAENFQISRSDSVHEIVEKINDTELIEAYAKLLKLEYEKIDIKYRDNLLKALYLTEYLQRVDTTFSWDRTILREDILRLLNN